MDTIHQSGMGRGGSTLPPDQLSRISPNALRAHHASAHGGLSANGLSDICLSFFEMILSSCLKLRLTVEHSII